VEKALVTLSRSESAHSLSGESPLLDRRDPSFSILGPLEEYEEDAERDDFIRIFRALARSSISCKVQTKSLIVSISNEEGNLIKAHQED